MAANSSSSMSHVDGHDGDADPLFVSPNAMATSSVLTEANQDSLVASQEFKNSEELKLDKANLMNAKQSFRRAHSKTSQELKLDRNSEELKALLIQGELTANASKATLMNRCSQDEKVLWTQSNKFQMIVGIVVMLNAVCLGVESDYSAIYPYTFIVLENFFTGIFTLELIAHLKVEGPRIYFSDSMNWLDCSLVAMSVVDIWIIQPMGIEADLRTMSLLRMLRLVRLARMLRLVRAFKELTILVAGMAQASRTLFWALIFLIVVVYAFAIFVQQIIGEAHECPDQQPDCGRAKYEFDEEVGNQASLFGSVDRSMLTLFICLAEGCGFLIMQPMVLKTPILIVFYLIFIFVTTLGILNLIVSAFCEQSLSTAFENEKEISAEHDKMREKLLKDLRTVFEEMDQDKSGTISADEFHDAMCNNEQVIKIIIDLGLGEEKNIFGILDCEGVGLVSFDLFFEGLMLIMKGLEPATAKNIVPTQLVKQATLRHSRNCENLLQDIFAQHGRLNSDIRSLVGLAPSAVVVTTKDPWARASDEEMLQSVTSQLLLHAVNEVVSDLPRDRIEFATQLQSIMKATGNISLDLRAIQRRLSLIEQHLDAEEKLEKLHRGSEMLY